MRVSRQAAEQYVYGVVAAGARPPGGTGVAGRRPQILEGQGIAAIVSALPPGELQASRAELMAHSRVLERALAKGVVLPMRFGVVMPDADAVRDELLDAFRDDLLEQLSALEGRVELHLQAVYDEQALLREILQAHPEIGARRQSLRGKPEDATYYARIELGQLVAEATERARNQDAGLIIDALEPLAVAVDVGEPQHERVAAQLAFLVEQARIGEFDAAVDELGRRNDGRMTFKYTGPLPAYSFVELPARA